MTKNLKRRVSRLLPALLALSFLAGCASQSFQAKEATNIKKIAVVKPLDPPFLLGANGDWANNGGGLLGVLTAEGVKAANAGKDFNVKFNGDMKAQHLTLGADLSSALQADLQKLGYTVTVVSLAAARPGELSTDYSSLKGQADAVLDLAIPSAGYAYRTWNPYEPAVMVRAQLTDLKTQRVLYSDIYSYARRHNGGDTLLQPSSGYEFRSKDAVFKDPQRAANGIRSSVQPIAAQISTALKR
ncbi:hypothetical protein ACFPL7_04170 [Dongia soli]|uniref:Lipoprotein n=1 Tax=Dongia soli TaxID=600628 RepID=A0ABU5EF04_9PROT|nr:hypothetical protein [Dongia soli]MDY0884512.1 hypothetical protein [Dongia soli]